MCFQRIVHYYTAMDINENNAAPNGRQLTQAINIIFTNPQNLANLQPTYSVAYPHLLNLGIAVRENPTDENIVILAHAVYGWMPTILHMNGRNAQIIDLIAVCDAICYLRDRIPSILDWFESLYAQNHDEQERLRTLAHFTNNSFVGLSKFLHFIFPDKFAIFDSNVLKNLNARNARLPKQANNVNAFIAYEYAINQYFQWYNINHGNQQISLRDIEIRLFMGMEQDGD